MSTSYQVNDFLQNRHPYKESLGFAAQAERDKNKLFHGHGLPSLEHNIRALTDTKVSVQNKIDIMRVILAHLAKPETKLRSLKFGILDSLKWVIGQNLGPQLDELACNSFRSLAVIPTCLFAIYRKDCIPSMIHVLCSRETASAHEDVLRAREAAGDALQQMSTGWYAKWLLLGEEVPMGMVDYEYMDKDDEPSEVAFGSAEDCEQRAHLGRTLANALCDILSAFNAGKLASLALAKSTLQSLINLSGVDAGLELCLKCNVLHEVDCLLRHYAENPGRWIGNAEDRSVGQASYIVDLAVTVVWNVCMDPKGKRANENLPVTLAKLLLAAAQYPMKYVAGKSALAGAISAIYVCEETKHTAVKPLLQNEAEAAAYGVKDFTTFDVTALLVKMVIEGNDMLALIRNRKGYEIDKTQSEQVLTENALALIKNSVQAIRMISELPAARPRVMQAMAGNKDVCSQVFKTTPIEVEMMGSSAQPAPMFGNAQRRRSRSQSMSRTFSMTNPTQATATAAAPTAAAIEKLAH